MIFVNEFVFWSNTTPGCATVSVLVISASQVLLELHGSRMGSPTSHRVQSKEYQLSSRDVVNSRKQDLNLLHVQYETRTITESGRSDYLYALTHLKPSIETHGLPMA